jgi:hypothetical protein
MTCCVGKDDPQKVESIALARPPTDPRILP